MSSSLTIYRQVESGAFARLRADRRGGALIIFALTLPVILGIVGASIDYGYMLARKVTLQAAADSGALAAASELKISGAGEDMAKSVGKSVAMANLSEHSGGATIDVQADTTSGSVTVAITQSPGLYFMDGLFGAKSVDINVDATAKVVGSTTICMLILDDKQTGALAVNKDARITGNDCAIHSNSVNAAGIKVNKLGHLAAKLICSSGGTVGPSQPQALSDCPAMEDPLALRPPPVVGPCTENGLNVNSGSVTLNPGVYCGGLQIGSTADVILNPGTYIIKDGAFNIQGSARVLGENVGFYLTGKNSDILMSNNTTVELTAPKDGDLAGILFFEDRTVSSNPKHKIKSNNARVLVGTFYLSRSTLEIDATKPLFDKSAYTVIIANDLNMFSGPNLVLNANFDETDIPVPPELMGTSGVGDTIILSK